MDVVLNNPFRVLGLSTTATEREIAKRISDLTLYAEMGKKVKFENDLDFLGEVDRSLNNIKEAAKRLENNYLKLFYSLMWFEIKDEIDKQAMELYQDSNDYGSFLLWKNSIFSKTKNKRNFVNFRKKGIDFIYTNRIKVTKSTKYEIEIRKRKIQDLSPSGGYTLDEIFIKTKLANNEFIKINETAINLPNFENYRLNSCLDFDTTESIDNIIKFCLFCSDNSSHIFININSNGILSIEHNIIGLNVSKYENVNNLLSNEYLIQINFLESYIDVWLNNEMAYKIDKKLIISEFFIEISGNQSITFKNLSTIGLMENQWITQDMEFNKETYSYMKNLAITQLISSEISKSSNCQLFFEIIGTILKQEYFHEYAKKINSDNFSIDFSKLSDIFIEVFYNSQKKFINPDILYSESHFWGQFQYLSNEASSKAKDKIISLRIYEFEELIKDTSNQRINKTQNSNILAKNLLKSAYGFLNWYLNLFSWTSIDFVKIQEKVGVELLECGISFYNNSIPNIEIAKEAIEIIKQSSEFTRSLDIRERIEKNLNIISELHGLEKIKIDFKQMDLVNYTRAINVENFYKVNS